MSGQMSHRNESLRPIERRVLSLMEAGEDPLEIATKFRKSPGFIKRVAEHSELPRNEPVAGDSPKLRPCERRVLKWREEGATYADIASRFRRSPRHIRQIEALAKYKLASD